MAQITLTVIAENTTDLLDSIRAMALPGNITVHVKPADAVVTPAADHVAPTTAEKLDKALDKAIDEVARTEAAVAAEAKPKRGRPAAKPVAAQATLLEPAAPAPAPAPAPVTVDQVKDELFAQAREALADYVNANKENGREKAIEILKVLGVARLTELDANGLQKFLALVKN